jgi:hypothetical protein
MENPIEDYTKMTADLIKRFVPTGIPGTQLIQDLGGLELTLRESGFTIKGEGVVFAYTAPKEKSMEWIPSHVKELSGVYLGLIDNDWKINSTLTVTGEDKVVVHTEYQPPQLVNVGMPAQPRQITPGSLEVIRVGDKVQPDVYFKKDLLQYKDTGSWRKKERSLQLDKLGEQAAEHALKTMKIDEAYGLFKLYCTAQEAARAVRELNKDLSAAERTLLKYLAKGE